jgi:twitching motility protein PilJ
MDATDTMKLPGHTVSPSEPLGRATPRGRMLGDLASLTAIGALFMIPIMALTWYVVTEQRHAIAEAQTRLQAYEYGAALSRFLLAVSTHRTASAQSLTGEPGASEDVGRAASEVAAAAAGVDARNVDHGASLNVADRWAQVRGRWARLQAERRGLSAAQSVEAHTDLINAGEILLGTVGRLSETGMSPAADRTDMAMSQVRDLAAASARIGAVQAQVSALARARPAGAEQREQLVRAVTDARAALDRAAGALPPGPKAGGKASTPGAATLDAARQLVDQAELVLVGNLALPFDATAWFAQTAQAMKALGNVAGEGSLRTRDRLRERVEALQRESLLVQAAAGALSAVALLGMVFFGRRLLRSGRHRHASSITAVEENRRNQAAIRRLMQELSSIEKGDLTAQATVTEDITGAIADSVNLTVGQLRKVVTDINTASGQVAAATEQARETARKLIAAATRQAQDIEAADVSVEMMTQSMGEIAAGAGESAQVARRTLASTESGSRAVQESIGGMDEIRRQIQETSKRIKRLGESSQEIGQIVDVITDIAEQTDVLALNAAIQAATAGEAGRAFAVVAEEVQLLAERSADATTQIAALVKTIQSDTQEAVTAMERSIQNVVEGTRLSNAAGHSLKEIEQITRNLTDMIQSIAVSTETQVVVAGEVREIMRDVLAVTGSTTEGTQRTSTSIAQTAELASGLRSSVSRFKVG